MNIVMAAVVAVIIGIFIGFVMWKDEEKRVGTRWQWKVEEMKKTDAFLKVLAIGVLTGIMGFLISSLILLAA